MAEFADVMMIAGRMCRTYDQCDECNICGETCTFAENIPENIDALKRIERKVMEWNEKHPEPKYPSWFQYQESIFPEHTRWICPMMFGVTCPCKSATNAHDCKVCRDKPIPADIAEKLGIKPINSKTLVINGKAIIPPRGTKGEDA